jgi:CBS-domain-containing membrane protein
MAGRSRRGQELSQMKTVRDVMTTNVVAVREDTGYKEIVALLRRHRVSAFPVVDSQDRVAGVVSEADLLVKAAAPALPQGPIRLAWRLEERSKATGATAADLMTAPPVTIGPAAAVREAAQLMQSRRVKRLPVTGEDGRLAGIISRTDVLSVFERPDEQIRDEVVKSVIAGELALDPAAFGVTVKSGIVTITGSVGRRRVALSLLAAARYIEGAVAVRDRLTYPAEHAEAG